MASLKAVGRPVSDATLLSMVEVYESSSWYDLARQDVPSVPQKGGRASPLDSAGLLHKGKELLKVLSRAYSRHICQSDSEKMWLRLTAKDPFIPPDKSASATLADALDAMAVLANECCVLNYMFVSELLLMCKNKAVRVMLLSMERLHALFMELLPNSKLRYIHQLDDAKMRYLHHHVSEWEKSGSASWDSLDPLARLLLHVVCFEDFFKGAYAAFIQVATDQLEGGEAFVKRRMLHYVFEMLARKPEQEGLLMDILVSKLLVDDNKISSAASAKLSALLECQAGMKEIVVRRIGQALSGGVGKVRTALSCKSVKPSKKKRSTSLPSDVLPTLKGMYRCILFMSELHFTRNESKATSEALKVYTSVLSFIFSRGESEKATHRLPLYEYEEFSRIIRCISSGLERCIHIVSSREGSFNIFDYFQSDGRGLSRESVEESVNSLYRAAHKPLSFSTNIGLLSLISKLQPFESRFYNLLYERVLDLRMFDATSRGALLSLISKCVSGDTDTARIAAFVKRLLQVSLCLVGSDVSTHISRICRRALCAHVELRSMLSDSSGDSYIPGKRDPRFSEADKSYLWESHLNRISYHPSVVTENCNLLKAPKDDGASLETHTLFQELGVISGQLRSGDFAYTQKSYWTDNRKAEPHQLVFKQFYEHKSECDFDSGKKKVSARVDELEYSDDEEIDDIDQSDDDVSGVDAQVPSDYDGTDVSDIDSLGDGTSSDEIDSIDESDFEDEQFSDTYEESSGEESASDVSLPHDEVAPKPRARKRDAALPHVEAVDRRPKVTSERGRDKRHVSDDSTKPSKRGTKESPSPQKSNRSKSKQLSKVVADLPDKLDSKRKRRKTIKEDRPEVEDPGREKRKKVSMLIQKATKGSFADISGIDGIDELL